MRNFLPLIVIILMISSCAKSDKITLVESTGRINHVLIVMNNEDWDGKIGDELKEIISQPVLGLPQEEHQFSVTQVDPATFNSLFKRNRNIYLSDWIRRRIFIPTVMCMQALKLR